ncbi:MAG: Rrf2 family transcriptional regulator [Verrucomicrobiales bacterium]|nr:Rrf2 family transcriptional regulator [Verrucomicrobiales bacterium]
MELNQFTDYALRTLIFAALKGEERASIHEIADSFSISENHLVKVVHKLSQLGYLKTFRGRAGGLILGKPADKIGVGEIVRALEPLSLVECMSPAKGNCRIAGICNLQSLLHRANDAFLTELDSMTVADLVTNRKELISRMGI